MSESEIIGQRIGERLLASGLLSSVEIMPEDTSLTLTLVPVSTLVLSDRVLRFCLNFLGERKQPIWRSHSSLCPWYVEVLPGNTCTITIQSIDHCIGYAQFDALANVTILGLQLSRTLPVVSMSYSPADLMRVYGSVEEVMALYQRFVAQVILAGDDLPTQECKPSLRDGWLCCPKHRLLFVQRLVLNDWLCHLLWEWEPTERALPDIEYLSQAPSAEDLKLYLEVTLARSFTPGQYLTGRFDYLVMTEKSLWGRPTRQCQRRHHVSFKCCPLHLAMAALWALYNAWLEHFDDLYGISLMKDEKGYAPGLFSVAGVALFIHLAGLDTSEITLSEGFRTLLSCDISRYHRQESGSTERRELR